MGDACSRGRSFEGWETWLRWLHVWVPAWVVEHSACTAGGQLAGCAHLHCNSKLTALLRCSDPLLPCSWVPLEMGAGQPTCVSAATADLPDSFLLVR